MTRNPAYTDTNPSEDLLVGTGALQGKLVCKVGSLFQTVDLGRLIKILGVIGVANSDSKIANDTRSHLFSTLKINNATLINAAKQRAEELCRDKWNTPLKKGLRCVDSPNSPIVIDSFYENATLIVRNGNVVIPETYLTSDSSRAPLDIFIDRGKLILKKYSSSPRLLSFTDYGTPASKTEVAVSSGLFLKGTFIVNGLIQGEGYHASQVPHKLFLHGKITTLNGVTKSPARIKHASQVLNQALQEENVYLPALFTWQCKGTSGTD